MKTERTTITVAKPILEQLRKGARDRGLSLSAFIILLAQEGLRSLKSEPVKKFKFKPVIVDGIYPPLIDVSDREAISKAIEGTNLIRGEKP